MFLWLDKIGMDHIIKSIVKNAMTGTLIFAAILLSSLLYFQNLELNKLKRQMVAQEIVSLPIECSKPSLNESILEINYIFGEIKDISSDYFTMEAKIADISKINEYDEDEPLPRLTKNYRITINNDTIFPSKKLDELKAGNWVGAYSKDPIYDTTEFTATIISYFTEEEAKMMQ